MDPVITLDADLTAAQARAVLTPVPAGFHVTIRRRPPDGSAEPLWYVVPVADLRARLEGVPDDQSVCLALGLDHEAAADSRQVTAPEVQDGSWSGLVVDGTRAIGVVEAHRRRTTRSLFPDRPTSAPEPAPAPAPIPPPTAMPSDAIGGDARPPAAPPASSAPPPTQPAPALEAYPRLEVPAEIAPGATFDVVIGLSTEQPAGLPSAMSPLLALAGSGRTIDLDVQVVADGFTAPDGIRRTLTVRREQLDQTTVSVRLVAPTELPNAASAQGWRGVVEVNFSAAGVLIARAWREVVVTPKAAAVAEQSVAGGGLAVAPADTAAADLTVTICEGTDPSRLVWTFTTPHDVPLPEDQVVSTLPIASALAFAMGQIKDVGSADGTPVADNRVMGVARAVASATPVELWEVLSAVWTKAKTEGRLPSLLLVSCEPYVPWELASVEPDWVVDRSLVDEAAPPVLGAQVRMGRWLPAGPRTPSGVQRPAVPPATAVEVSRMAVVVGDYKSESGLRPLPEALEEGKALTKTYPAVWVKGVLDEVAALLDATLTDHGDAVAPELVHMACHGEVDPAHPAYNGIVLSDTALRMDPTIVRGSALGRASAPMVFLNACQLAQSSGELLCDYGGLAGAFLTEGCRGFVAPLWSVDDGLAYDTAVEFYRLCLEEHVAVGEALRRLRGRFTTLPGQNQTTPLAYVFYGHPDLQLSLAA